MSAAIHTHTETGSPLPDESRTGLPDPEQQRRLEFQWERTSHLLRDALSQRLRAEMEIRFRSQQVRPFDQFVRELEVPTGTLRFRGGPPDFPFLFDPGPRLFFPMLDRLLGGRPTPAPQRRPLTQLDRRVAMQLGTWIADTIVQAWNEPRLHRAEPLGVECDPQQIRVVAADEPVLIVGFDARFDGIPGLVRLCLPLSALRHETESPDTAESIEPLPATSATTVETAPLPDPETPPEPAPESESTPVTRAIAPTGHTTLELRLTLPPIALSDDTPLAVGDLLPVTPPPGHSLFAITIDGETIYDAIPTDGHPPGSVLSGYPVRLRRPPHGCRCGTDCNSR